MPTAVDVAHQPAARAAVRPMPHSLPLDGLRGVAVLAVVLFHFSPEIMPAGFLGVDVFFVLSGYLITSLLVREVEGTAHVALWAFWARRARRLLPALLLLVVVVAGFVVFIAEPVEAQHVSDDGLAALFYVGNWRFIASGQPYILQYANQAASPLRHMWSLAIEEQFYLVWPLVVAGIGTVFVRARRLGTPAQRRRMFRYAVVAVCLVVGAASLLRMSQLYEPLDPNRAYYGTDTRIFAMLFGAALGALTAGVPTIVAGWWRRAAVGAGCVAAIAIVGVMGTLSITSAWLYTGGYGLLAAAMVLVLAAAAQPGPNPLGWLLARRPLVRLGLISYGVYLWQWPATVWITSESTGTTGVVLFALRALATLAAAMVSYVAIEQPIRQRRLPRLHLRLPNPAMVPLAGITLISVILLVPAMTLPNVQLASAVPVSQATARATAAYAAVSHCSSPDAKPRAEEPLVPDHKIRVQYLGNSLAVESLPCLTRALAARNAVVDGVVKVGYPICDLLPSLREAMRDPARRPDIGVVYAAPVVDPSCGDAGTWRNEMKAVISIWRRAGVHTFLVADLPFAGTRRWSGERKINEELAARDPEHVTALDASAFLQDDFGVFQARMPCIPGGEPGCTKGWVNVRSPVDHMHFCAETDWPTDECPPTGSGGIRRLVAAMVVSLADALRNDPSIADARR
jgi:peptidoglycan/LPS O-acetylase OafA/YrhL